MAWCRYIGDSCFIGTHGEERIKEFNVFNLNIQFAYESSKKGIAFLDRIYIH